MSLIDNNNLLQALTEFKNRLNDPIYVDPMDVKDQHTAGYCQLAMNNDQTLPASPTGTKTKIVFDLLIASNMVYSTITNSIQLKANKTYKIFACIQVSNSSTVDYFVVNTDSNDSLGYSFGRSIASNYSSTYGEVPYEMIYTPSVDMNISVVAYYNPIDTTIYKYFGKFIVQEITQPVVVEYNKEVSNPLTTTDIPQESPVGSMISYNGLTAPVNYLECSGNVYNIADYPYLADKFLAEYGKKNYYGGDGITTFAVPTIDRKAKNTVPIMTSNIVPYGIASSDSCLGDATNSGAFNVFDKYLIHGWHSADVAFPHYIGYEYTSTTIISSYSIKLRAEDANDVGLAPKSWTFQGWNGSAWVTLDTKTNVIWSNSGQEQLFIFANNTAYIKYRLNITANNGYPGNIVAIAHMQFFNSAVSTITCIKYKPTYSIVNQYGGFESKTLFDGNANVVGDYTLSDSIEKYDFLIVYAGKGGYSTYLNSVKTSVIVPTNGIIYGRWFDYNISIYEDSTNFFQYVFSFASANIFHIVGKGTGVSTGYQASHITKIIGIKGKLPTLLTGGEF